MDNPTGKVHRKVYGLFIRETSGENTKLLVYTAPDGMFRFPGGTVEDDENLLTGLKRELQEEVGNCDFKVLRALGSHRYYKPDVHKYVERHDYLLQATIPLPDTFSFTVQSDDKDAGMIFDYHWIGSERVSHLHWEFKNYITPKYIPELFRPVNI